MKINTKEIDRKKEDRMTGRQKDRKTARKSRNETKHKRDEIGLNAREKMNNS